MYCFRPIAPNCLVFLKDSQLPTYVYSSTVPTIPSALPLHGHHSVTSGCMPSSLGRVRDHRHSRDLDPRIIVKFLKQLCHTNTDSPWIALFTYESVRLLCSICDSNLRKNLGQSNIWPHMVNTQKDYRRVCDAHISDLASCVSFVSARHSAEFAISIDIGKGAVSKYLLFGDLRSRQHTYWCRCTN